jgi:hypothetical protein
MRVSTVSATLLKAATGGLLGGSVYSDDGVWRGSAEGGGMPDEAGLNESALADGHVAEQPTVADQP